ncbi:MAG: thiamine biosynthesis protein ThiF [Longimicrobiales bacterium]
MTEFNAIDRLHRLEKLLLQTGEARSPEEARRILASYSMQFVAGPEIKASSALQVALLTAVNTARRAVHGEVRVIGESASPLLVPIPGCQTVGEAVKLLGGTVATAASTAPALLLGTVGHPDLRIALRVVCRGWAGGVVPADDAGFELDEGATTLAGAIAGAVGVSELFQSLRGMNPRAGLRSLGYSAWGPGTHWMRQEALGPQLEYLPTSLWVVGLGHLGQSLVWNLGFLPYSDPAALKLVFQDFDRLTPANVSTSPLAFDSGLGQMKTRVAAMWAERIGFRVRLVERAFAADFTPNSDEPRLAFCGVDNLAARAALEAPGFEAIVEAGLGTGEEYHAFQLHTFPGPEKAAERWVAPRGQQNTEWTEGFDRLAKSEELDDCGKTELAGLQVASSYVGVVTSALAIGQMLRPLHGAPMHASVSGTLGSSGAPSTVIGLVGRRAPRYGNVAAAAPLVGTG